VLLAFVSLGVSGGGVPTGWTVPIGFKQLGANFSMSGTGTSQTTCATGVWVKLADADDVAATDFSTTINLPTGTKVIQTTMVAIQNCFLVPGGVQIRMAGKPIRRLLAFAELTAASATLCDFQNISAAYDNLELVYDGTTNATAGVDTRLQATFNGDNTGTPGSTGHYYHSIVQDGGAAQTGILQTRLLHGAIGATATSKATGRLNIYGYNSSAKPVMLGQDWWVASGPVVHSETLAGQWDGNGGVSAINRIVIGVNGAPANPIFAIGSRAYLYGY
jgi:hypothetical protein